MMETSLRKDTEFDAVMPYVQKLGIQCNAGCDFEMFTAQSNKK